MDSFVFHPVRPSFHQSFSTDSEITSSLSFNINPCPPSNSSILSGLLNQEVNFIPPVSSSQSFSFGSGVPFPHPQTQLMEDLSV